MQVSVVTFAGLLLFAVLALGQQLDTQILETVEDPSETAGEDRSRTPFCVSGLDGGHVHGVR